MTDSIDALKDYIVTYRDTYGAHRTFNVAATSNDEATELAVAWKGNAPIAIMSVREFPPSSQPSLKATP